MPGVPYSTILVTPTSCSFGRAHTPHSQCSGRYLITFYNKLSASADLFWYPRMGQIWIKLPRVFHMFRYSFDKGKHAFFVLSNRRLLNISSYIFSRQDLSKVRLKLLSPVRCYILGKWLFNYIVLQKKQFRLLDYFFSWRRVNGSSHD